MVTSHDIMDSRVTDGITQTPPAPVKVSELPGSLPQSRVPEGVDFEEVVSTQLQRLLSLSQDDLLDSAIWRDLLALTGTYRTFYSAKKVVAAWKGTFDCQMPVNLTLVANTARIFKVLDVSSWIDADFTFKVTADGPQRFCSGIISFALDKNGQWKIWMIRTTLDGIADIGDVDVLDPVVPSEDVREGTSKESGALVNGHKQKDILHFDVIVVGGGQAGLGVGGRLQALNVSYLVVDKFGVTGDSWNSRYDSTKREFSSLLPLCIKV